MSKPAKAMNSHETFPVRAFCITCLAIMLGSGCSKNGDQVIAIDEHPARICVSVYSNCDYPTKLISSAVVVIQSGTYTDSCNQSGTCCFDVLPSRSYQITATAPYYFSTSVRVDTVSPGDTISLDFWLDRSSGFTLGELMIGFPDSTLLATAYRLPDSLGFLPLTVGNFVHRTRPMPLDSARAVAAILLGKPYINDGFVITSERGNSSFVSVYYFMDMDREAFFDWMSIRDSLGLFELPDMNKWFLIDVPIGFECFWVQRLKLSPIVRYLGLNNRYQPHLLKKGKSK